MNIRKDIVGVWSVGARYEPQGMEETTLIFRDDGTGWLLFQQLSDWEVHTFRWTLPDPARAVIDIQGQENRSNWRKKRPSDWSFGNMGFTVAKEPVPKGGSMTVLTFDRQVYISKDKFGLITRKTDTERLPWDRK